MINSTFDRIEAYLRALFEKKLPRIFTGHRPHATLVDELLQVMQKTALRDDTGKLFAPDLYLLRVSPQDLVEWQLHQDILDEIAHSIHNIGESVNLVFRKPPKIELTPEATIPVGGFSIAAHFASKDPALPDTAVMTAHDGDESTPELPENAMLIIAGKASYPLVKPVIDIGRHSSNDLALSDLHVSRHHAQLRAIKDHYVIFDVGSTAGVYLNGRRISQATLHAGDVIRLGTVNLIYNQEPTSAFPTSILPVDPTLDEPGDDLR